MMSLFFKPLHKLNTGLMPLVAIGPDLELHGAGKVVVQIAIAKMPKLMIRIPGKSSLSSFCMLDIKSGMQEMGSPMSCFI